ncbi:MAG: hypothetical protein IJZ64_00645 [Ruminococcus sp.]|nr:hypothetical protein [Ruminococcus sp.]
MKKNMKLISLVITILTFINIFEYKVIASDLNGEVYINEVFGNDIYNEFNIDYSESYEIWQKFLDEKAQTDEYLGVPYNASLYVASPKCDPWQGYIGTNCTGFVWHIISNGIKNGLYEETGLNIDIKTSCKWVPNVSGFNNMGFSRKCWGGGGWWTFVTSKKVHYYEFTGNSAKQDMLESGVMNKGDIIWCVDPASGREGLAGLAVGSLSHHIGIYMGDGTSDLWWHSGVSSGEPNSICPITGVVNPCTYVVIPWSEKVEYTIGDVNGDNNINVDDASLVLEYYAKSAANLEAVFSDDETENELYIKAADVDKDGEVSVDDASFILSYYAQDAAGLFPKWNTLIKDGVQDNIRNKN